MVNVNVSTPNMDVIMCLWRGNIRGRFGSPAICSASSMGGNFASITSWEVILLDVIVLVVNYDGGHLVTLSVVSDICKLC